MTTCILCNSQQDSEQSVDLSLVQDDTEILCWECAARVLFYLVHGPAHGVMDFITAAIEQRKAELD